MYPNIRELEQLARERRKQWENVISEIADNANRRDTQPASPSTNTVSDCPARLPPGIRRWRQARAWLARIRL